MDCKMDINHPCHAVVKGTWNKSCHYPGLSCSTVSSFDNLTLQKRRANCGRVQKRPLRAITGLKNMRKDVMAKEKKAEADILAFQYITGSC